MSNHITAKLDFLALASFRACQTIDRCSQQPGIFSMQPFRIEVSINLLLCIRWASNRLETKLKKSLPSTFKRAIGQKFDSLLLEGLLTLGMYISWALCHWMEISHLLKQVWKEICLFWDIVCKTFVKAGVLVVGLLKYPVECHSYCQLN